MRSTPSTVARLLVTILGAVVLLAGIPAAAVAAAEPSPTIPPSGAPASLAYATVPCDPNGTTSADAALATRLNTELQADMRGYMTAYRASCARMVVDATRARGLTSRAAVIAVTTVIVETHLQNISEEVDHTSLGLFQQQEWWGTREQRLNATWATNKFLSVMQEKYPNNAWMTAPIGEVCQRVQVSAYPDRYQAQAGDAQIIVNALWGSSGRRGAPAMMRDDGDGTMTIWRSVSSGSGFTMADDLFESGPWTTAQVGDRVAAGDVNGDGRDDIVAAYENSGGKLELHVWLNGRVYADKWYISPGSFSLGPVAGRLVVGDFTGDGRAEPAMMRDNGDGTMTIWRWTSSGSGFTLGSSRYTSGPWTMAQVGDRIAAGDIDDNGQDDIVAAYQNADGKFTYHIWKGGLTHNADWYTSPGPFSLGPVAGRLAVGTW